MRVFTRLVVSCLALVMLFGCAGEPVRHLASDASLITPGVSTRDDVLTYLGDPDDRQEGGPGPVRWLYYQEYRSAMQRTFDFWNLFGPDSVSRIIVTFDGDLVTDIRYEASESGEFEEPDKRQENRQ
ncbi:MAG: hypothetical protein LJE64_12135 [Desulfofustis sp.]|jgi:hypothetical protein|nr:hypothetical protein [Desulfofustis sp.]